MNLHSIFYTIYEQERSNLFGDVKSCCLRGEGRRDWEVGLRYGVSINRMITLESI